MSKYLKLDGKKITQLRKKFLSKKVKIICGDHKNNYYVVSGVSLTGHLVLKDLYGLNSKKKSYNWKIHYSNTKIE